MRHTKVHGIAGRPAFRIGPKDHTRILQSYGSRVRVSVCKMFDQRAKGKLFVDVNVVGPGKIILHINAIIQASCEFHNPLRWDKSRAPIIINCKARQSGLTDCSYLSHSSQRIRSRETSKRLTPGWSASVNFKRRRVTALAEQVQGLLCERALNS
ncbi:unnamed protein product [Polarella glacialis]|uniref:Uncharacterized protein n=1 Tax=Polarella glacialis TaxID=89957 RepID=A0A813I3Z6_POLGL|nr:unnamed protein product [Polarella glacialis]